MGLAVLLAAGIAEVLEEAVKFLIEPHDGADKQFQIMGPPGITLLVDYDDVDHEEVDRLAGQIAEILSRHWPE